MRLTKLLGFVMACALVFNSTSIVYAAEANPSDREIPVITQQAMGEVVPIVQNQARVAGNVSAGYVTGYLDAASDYDIYTVTIPNGNMLQAQLQQPASSSIDYDLYIFDMDGNMVAGSENVTNVVNGGTLAEAVGYINTSGADEDFYLYVNSFAGGSTTNAYTLTYAFTDVYDNYEVDEQPGYASEFVMSGSSDSISTRTISSPIDSDWYMVTVPANYDQMQLAVSSTSSNAHAITVYQNIATDGTFKMTPVTLTNGKLDVTAGSVYYFKVHYSGALNGYVQTSIETYTLSIEFSEKVLNPGSITITGYSGGSYVSYQYGRFYRVTDSTTLTVNGRVRDTEGNVLIGAPVVVGYANPAWDGDPRYGLVTATGVTDTSGNFSITITLPPDAGLDCYYVDPSTHYFDLCALLVMAADGVTDTDYIYQYAYSAYGDNTK